MQIIEHNGYYPLTKECLELFVPARPGIYMLAVQLSNGVRQNFFTSQSDNLYKSLKTLAAKDARSVPEIILEYMEHYQCYFTYFVIMKNEYRNEIEKMLAETHDPIVKLQVLNAN